MDDKVPVPEPRMMGGKPVVTAAHHLSILERRKSYLMQTASTRPAYEEMAALIYVLEHQECLLEAEGAV